MKKPTPGIRRRGRQVEIDVLACAREIEAGTFSDAQKATLDRMLPGVYNEILKGIALRKLAERNKAHR
jgi:hypothetical protein